MKDLNEYQPVSLLCGLWKENELHSRVDIVLHAAVANGIINENPNRVKWNIQAYTERTSVHNQEMLEKKNAE